jgi:hypothetical protein
MKMKIHRLLVVGLTLALHATASQVTNSVSISTNVNMLFCLARVGVDGAQSQFKADEVIRYMLIGPSTNVIYLRKFPSGNFDFHLFDENGKEVSKTKAGLALTGAPPRPTAYEDIVSWKAHQFFPFFIGEGVINQNPLFRPDDVFVIPIGGVSEHRIRGG